MKPLIKKILRPFLAISLSVSGAAVIATAVAGAKENATRVEAYSPSTTYNVDDTSSELTSYYSSISSTATGDTLLSQLRSLNSTKKKTTVGYGSMGTSASGAFSYTDYDPSTTSTDSKGQKYGSKVLSFYTKTSATSFNREHTWPKSHGGNLIEGDIHMTRPTISSENSDRGNSFYVEGKNSSSAGWDPYTAGYAKEMRGECARIILYGVVANSQLNVVAADSHSTSNANPDYLMGNMHTLVKWHFDYSPNEYEMNRNNGAQYLQGNRNPFIDHPEYVAKIWSDFDSTVSSICEENASMYTNWVPGTASSYGTNDGATAATAPTKLTLNTTSTSLSYGQTLSLTVTPTPSDAVSTVTWSSSNTNIATVSENGVVTAKNTAGYVNITATSTADSSITATCQIYVTEPTAVALTSISLSAGSTSISVGKSTSITVTNTPSNAYPTPTYTFTSSDTSKATVSSAGLVTGVAEGSATITVKAFQDGVQKTSKTINITVTAGSSDFEKVTSTSDVTSGEYLIVYESGNLAFNGGLSTLDATSNTISATASSGTIVANTTTEAATFTISGSTNATIKSKSGYYIGNNSNSNSLSSSTSTQYTNTITIDDSGNANIVSSGGAYLRYNTASDQARFRYYKSSSYTNQKAIQLYKLGAGSSSTSSVSLDKSTLALETGNSSTLVATTSGTGTLSWGSNNANVATVDTNGKVTATGAGTAIITATYGDASATCTVTVTAPKVVSNLTISGSPTNTQYAGYAFDPTGLTVTAHYSDNTTANVTSQVTWTPSVLELDTTSVVGSYNGVQTSSIAITVEEKAIDNSILKVYQQSTSTEKTLSFDVYGLYVGMADGKNPVIMNGEYGITLYGTAVPSSWVANETHVKISSGFKGVYYNNLCEIKSYTATVITDATEIRQNISPVSIYKVLGSESTSDLTIASRLCLVTGTVNSITESTNQQSQTELTVSFYIDGSSTKEVKVFVKANNVSTLQTFLTSAQTSGDTVTLKGFTSFYKTTFEVFGYDYVEIDTSYTAQSFAEDLLSMTELVCVTSTNKEGDLSGIWLSLETEKYATLPNSEKAILLETVANNAGTDLEQAMARYDFIIAHYHSLNNFIGRSVTLVNVNNHFLFANSEATTAMIVIITVVGLTGIGAVLFLRRRKEN